MVSDRLTTWKVGTQADEELALVQADLRVEARLASSQAAGVMDLISEVLALGKRSKMS